MMRVLKRILISCGCFILFIVSIPILIYAYYVPKTREAIRFGDALIPRIEAARRRDGKYPRVIDPKWIDKKHIPQLINLQDFYHSDGDDYSLNFRNPGGFLDDDTWDYQCAPKERCSWLSFDSNW